MPNGSRYRYGTHPIPYSDAVDGITVDGRPAQLVHPTPPVMLPMHRCPGHERDRALAGLGETFTDLVQQLAAGVPDQPRRRPARSVESA
jgi:hypothetical protein